MLKINIEDATQKNKKYRKILSTTKNMQLVLMSLKPGEDIPMETHKGSQFIRVESGNASAIIGKKQYRLKDGDSVVIPENVPHYVKNTGKVPLKLYALYTPPEHSTD